MSAVIPEKVDLSKYIEMREGRPNIRGRRLPIMLIVITQRENSFSIAELADDFTLSEEQVLAALLYYREHRIEVDAQDAEDSQIAAELRQLYGGRKLGQA